MPDDRTNLLVAISRRKFMGALWVCSVSGPALVASASSEPAGRIVFENANLRYTLSAEGRNLGCVDKLTGRDYLEFSPASAFVSLKKGGKNILPTACRREGARIISTFFELNAQVICTVHDRGGFFQITVESVRGDGIEEISLLNLRLSGLPHLGRISNLAFNDDFGVAVMALNLQTKAGCGTICDTYLGADVQPAPPLILSPSWWDRGQQCNIPARGPSGEIMASRQAVLSASCFPKLGMQGASVALLGCPAGQLRDRIKQLVKKAGFIQSDLGGAWALDASQNYTSYLFCLATEHDIDDWIQLAKAGGFKTLVLDKFGPHGQYNPDPKKFPHGLDGVRRTVQKIRDAGLVPAWHTLSFAIDKNDPWVTPIPHHDLAVRSTVTLARDISAGDTFIPITELPAELPPRAGFWVRGGTDIAVNGEILTYRGLQTSPPYGLTGCVRGAHGTRASAHAAGTSLRNLQEVFERYVPAANSALMDAMQARMAEIIRTCEFEMFYLDGLDGADIFEGPDWSWYHGPKFAAGVIERVGRPVGMEASGWYHHNWHLTSRIGAWDGTDRDHQRFVDLHVKNNLELDELLPKQLGWWKLVHDQGRQGPASLPEDIEYLCAKRLGYDEPFSLNSVTPAGVKASPLWSRLIEIMGRYERLRQGEKVPESVKAKLRVLGDEYRLTEDSQGNFQFLPIFRAVQTWARGEITGAPWTVNNHFGPQRSTVRIRALTSVDAYDSPEAIILVDFSKEGEFAIRSARDGVVISQTPSTPRIASEGASGLLAARNDRAQRQGAWGMMGKVLVPAIDLSQHPALGVWVHGDGNNEILNFQIHDANGPNAAVEEHYVTVDFTGWRYFELVEAEAARWNGFQWPYSEWFAVYGEPVDLGHTTNLNLYYNNLQPGSETRCLVSPVKALALRPTTLYNLRLDIGATVVEFPVELKSGDYLECDAEGHGKVFDANGFLISEFRTSNPLPMLPVQETAVRFDCDCGSDLNPRAQVSLITMGIPLSF